jgi:hypothetical protein
VDKLAKAAFYPAIELKSERSPLGGVGLGSLKGCVVGFAWGGSPTFSRSMPSRTIVVPPA